MTVIAWDGATVAADTAYFSGGLRRPCRGKITRHGSTVYGFTGTANWREAWVKWHREGADANKIPVCKGTEGGDYLIVFSKGQCFLFLTNYPYPMEEFAPMAWGYGREFALGAMSAGAKAIQACKIAVAHCAWCGGEIESIPFKMKSAI